MRGLRLLWLVIRKSGLGGVLTSFLVLYLVLTGVIWWAEPGVTTYVDALWFMWAVATTVGLGDITAETLVGRACVVVFSLSAIVTTAIITGVTVDFFNERRAAQLNSSLTELMDKLERLPELSREELADISARVRKFRS